MDQPWEKRGDNHDTSAFARDVYPQHEGWNGASVHLIRWTWKHYIVGSRRLSTTIKGSTGQAWPYSCHTTSQTLQRYGVKWVSFTFSNAFLVIPRTINISATRGSSSYSYSMGGYTLAFASAWIICVNQVPRPFGAI